MNPIAVVLCAGEGTRLRAVIGEKQKCAVEVGGRPWIHRVLDFLAEGGVELAILMTGYRHEEIEQAAALWDQARSYRANTWAMGLTCMFAGVIGPEKTIELAFQRTGQFVLLVVNGDTLADFDLKHFLEHGWIGDPVGVVGVNAVTGETAGAGFRIRVQGSSQPEESYPARGTFLDIGSPEGLALARERYSS